jgi:hypothetical protein
VIEKNVFRMKNKSPIPIEIKCMVALRILGRGSCADDMSEMSGVGESTCNSIFKRFIAGMSVDEVFNLYVHPPAGAKLTEVMDTYARLGFPGAVGSIDCTHIFWSKCPVELTNLCRGKDKYPSLSFEVVADHTGRIHSCTDGFMGTFHDSMIVVNDAYAREIRDGKYKDLTFSLYTQDGRLRTFKGGYLISDAGYTKYWMFQQPNHHAWDERTVYWSEYLESVRKDVERVFGVLKQRFFFLSHRVQYHDPATITADSRCGI